MVSSSRVCRIPLLVAALLLVGCGPDATSPPVSPELALRDGVSPADSIALGAHGSRLVAANLSGVVCELRSTEFFEVLFCGEPLPVVTPTTHWLRHSGGIFEAEQRVPISITFNKPVHSITLSGIGALRCSGSLGRIIGHRNGVEVVNVSNVLTNPEDCGEDDISFAVAGAVPANIAVDHILIEGPEPWTFPVGTETGRARLDYSITYDPSTGLHCDRVERGATATCRILGGVESVSAWHFAGAPLPPLGDSARVSHISPALEWSGTAVLPGVVSVIYTADGTIDTLSTSFEVDARTGPTWSWIDGSKWTLRQDGPAQCAYSAFVIPGSTRLAVNRRTGICEEVDALQNVSIEPSMKVPAAQDSAYQVTGISDGPNEGLWFVSAASFYMDRTTEMNPYIRPNGATLSLTNATDLRLCRKELGLGKNAPVVVGFHTYNTVCRTFALTAMFDAIWAHEAMGTNNPLDSMVANGHEARRRVAARDTVNDPYRLAEPMVRTSETQLRQDVALDVDDADLRIKAMADADHWFVGNNYLVQGVCGKAWVFNTPTLTYAQIVMTIVRPDGTLTCI